MDAKLIDQPFDSKEPGKWLRHKTLSGSYVARTWEVVVRTQTSVLIKFNLFIY